jgi:hypothetical protein
MGSRLFAPRTSAIGSFAVAASLVITLSFLVTTPDLDPDLAHLSIPARPHLRIFRAPSRISNRARRADQSRDRQRNDKRGPRHRIFRL